MTESRAPLFTIDNPSAATNSSSFSRFVLPLALAFATAVAAFFWMGSVEREAHLLHFDAKAHLVVARRVIDNITPGWTQLGAVWLPLPHMLNALPAQNDTLYRTGLFASALGFVFFVAGLAALAAAAARATGDPRAGVVALLVPALNPAWLYLQSTPLTEPLFFGLINACLYYIVRHVESRAARHLWAAALCSAGACWVRYEAWPLAALAMTILVLMNPDRRARTAWIAYGAGFAGPILLYGLHSWVATGIPFHAIDSENLTQARGHIGRALSLLIRGTQRAFGWPLVAALALAGLAILFDRARRRNVLTALSLATFAPAAVTFVAYLAGHPEKARYCLLLASSLALLLAVATARRPVLQIVALGLALTQTLVIPRPLPVLREATRDRQDVLDRRPVTARIRQEYRGGRILVSMGSLAPVIFELGLPIREIVHEGNGYGWDCAMINPKQEVSWVIARDGDVLERMHAYRPDFPEGFVAVMRVSRFVVYRRASDLLPQRAARPASRTTQAG